MQRLPELSTTRLRQSVHGLFSASVVLVPRSIKYGVKIFAVTKHLVCATYLFLQALLYLTLNPLDLEFVQAYAPITTAISYFGLAALHLGLLASMVKVASCTKRNVAPAPSPTLAAIKEASPTHPSHKFLERLLHPAKWFRSISEDTAVIAFNVIAIAAQTHQAVRVSNTVPDRWFVTVFLVIVILYCFISPWQFFVVRSHSKAIFINWMNSIFSFSLSTFLPFIGVLPLALEYAYVDSTLANDPMWSTRIMLAVRIVIVTSPRDFVSKVAIGLGTVVSLDRLGDSLASTRRRLRQPKATPRRTHRALVAGSLAWGVILAVFLARSYLSRAPCSPLCLAVTAPLFDLECQCALVWVNCHALGDEQMDVDALLASSNIGSTVFYLEVTRCALPLGLSNATLAPLVELGRVFISFTQTREWDAVLPPTVKMVSIRYTHLDHVPRILHKDKIPSTLRTLYLESNPMHTVPLDDTAWLGLVQLFLVNSTVDVDVHAIAKMHNLIDLSFRRGQLSRWNRSQWEVFLTMPNQFRSLDLTTNSLADGPWPLVNPFGILALTSNPIATVPDAVAPMLADRSVIMDNTPFCTQGGNLSFCNASVCAPNCEWNIVGNRRCDLVCFNAACDFDGHDCEAFGLTPPHEVPNAAAALSREESRP